MYKTTSKTPHAGILPTLVIWRISDDDVILLFAMCHELCPILNVYFDPWVREPTGQSRKILLTNLYHPLHEKRREESGERDGESVVTVDGKLINHQRHKATTSLKSSNLLQQKKMHV